MNIAISSRQFSLVGQYWADHFLLIALCFPRRGSAPGLIWMDWCVMVSWHLVHCRERWSSSAFPNGAVKYPVEHRRAVCCSLAWPGMSTLPCCSVCTTPDICIPLPSRGNLFNPLCSHLKDEIYSLCLWENSRGSGFPTRTQKKFPFFPHFSTYFIEEIYLILYWFNRIIILSSEKCISFFSRVLLSYFLILIVLGSNLWNSQGVTWKRGWTLGRLGMLEELWLQHPKVKYNSEEIPFRRKGNNSVPFHLLWCSCLAGEAHSGNSTGAVSKTFLQEPEFLIFFTWRWVCHQLTRVELTIIILCSQIPFEQNSCCQS